MRTLIIPCMGRKMIYGMPQWLLKHPTNVSILDYGISKINRLDFDNIIVVIYESDLMYENAEYELDKIKNTYSNVRILVLKNLTNGPAETVYLTIKKLQIRGPVVIKDVDVITNELLFNEGNYIVGINLEKNDDITNLKNKSFLILNEQKQILDVIEKHIKSEYISMGVYGFENAEDLISTYEKLTDVSYGIKRIYISHIIAYLIGRYNKIFYFKELKYYEIYDNEKIWEECLRKYCKYIIDYDKIAAFYNCNNLNKCIDVMLLKGYKVEIFASDLYFHQLRQYFNKKIAIHKKYINTDIKVIDNLIELMNITHCDSKRRNAL